MQVANTILEQLGGGRFLAMTGAKSLMGGDRALSFRLPANFARDGINAVRVELANDDTYSVTFYRVRGVAVQTVASLDQVYADQIRETFRGVTGLEVSL